MLDQLFQSIISNGMTADVFIRCSITSILLGGIIAKAFSVKNHSSGNFITTLALLPFMVQVIILLVNGDLGTGVAVMGTFSLIRFRSVPGNAKEIASVLLAMAVGLAAGTGFVGVAIVVAVVTAVLNLFYSLIGFGGNKRSLQKEIKVTIPESLDYTGIFDDLFEKYTKNADLVRVRTTNMGSLYQLFYLVDMKQSGNEKEFIDAMRCRNGNLEITCGKVGYGNQEL